MTDPLPLATFFGPAGPMASAFPAGDAYEHRPQQVAMAEAVAASLSSGRHALVEAGTGVGKSFAYLVPLLDWAEREDKTVAVSTSTIALQEQLVQKDLPTLRRLLPFDVSFAIVKGRGNHLCLRRLDRALADSRGLFDTGDAGEQLRAIRDWATGRRFATRQELPFRPHSEVWDAVRAESGNCLHKRCGHYADCGYQVARRRTHTSRLLVVNHHVLLADLALRRQGGVLSSRPRRDRDRRGLMTSKMSPSLNWGHGSRAWARCGCSAASGARGAAKACWRAVGRRDSSAGPSACAVRSRGSSRTSANGSPAPSRAAAGRSLSRAGRPWADPLSEPLEDFARALIDAAPTLGDQEQAMEVRVRATALLELSAGLASVLGDQDEDQVRWIEATAAGRVVLCRAPVDVGPSLREVLFDAHESVVMTSATLALGRPPRFDFVAGRLGVQGADTHAFGSPFDHARQVVLRLRTDLPDPSRDALAHHAALPEAVLVAVPPTSGGALLLFTSYRSMETVAVATRDAVRGTGHGRTRPGGGARAHRDARALPGGRLCAVRRRLVLAGRGRARRGADRRRDHAPALRGADPSAPAGAPTARGGRGVVAPSGSSPSPQAALRLKQGFGRLVRRKSDGGRVTILDPRITTKRYGRWLLDSLPACPVERIGGMHAG